MTSVIEPASKHFFAAEKFAVVGRVLTDPHRYDYKVFRWYLNRDLPVTPVRPGEAGTVEGKDIIPGLDGLTDLPNTSISFIIHPFKGLPLLKKLYPSPPDPPNEPNGVWFQPGADDDAVRAYVQERNIQDRVVVGGPCILVSGDRARDAEKAGKL